MDLDRASFDIQTFADGRWTTVAVRETESMALLVARNSMANPSAKGARVVRCWKRHDGTSSESVVFTEMRPVAEGSITVVAITEAPFCTDIYQYYDQPSRATIGRVFRHYLEKVYVTPTELLHNSKASKKLQEFGTLFSAAVDRVATIQGNLPDQDAKERREALHRVAAKLLQRAKRAEEHPKLPRFEGAALDKVLDEAAGLGQPGREGFFALVVLCKDLVMDQSWLGKFDHLAQILAHSTRDDVVTLVDGIIADLVGITSAFQDIMGFQRNLAHLLCAIADLCENKFDAEKSDARDQLAVVAPLLAAGRLPQTRTALLERLEKLLAGRQALDRHDPSRETAAYRQVQARLSGPDGMFGGEAIASALKARAVQMFGPGGVVPPQNVEKPLAIDPTVHSAFKAEMARKRGAKTKSFPPGSVIFKEGDPPDQAYMVLSGCIEVTTMHKTQRIILARMTEDAIFGEFALFSPSPRTASAVTITGCELQVIDAEDMDRQVEALDPFTRYWMAFLIDRLTDLSRRWIEGKKEATL